MVKDAPAPTWRNALAWSAVGAAFYAPLLLALVLFVGDAGPAGVFRSPAVAVTLGLTLLFSTAVVGLSYRNRPLRPGPVRIFVIQNVVAIALLLLFLWGLRVSGGGVALAGLPASARVAAGAGASLVVIAAFGAIAMASAFAGADLVDEETADELRERTRLHLYSLVWTALCGALLGVLGFGGPGGVLSPGAALGGALALIGALAGLLIPIWRLSDELTRTLSLEAGSIAFYLVVVIGGGWAMLAHLGFAEPPAPIDWLTLSAVLMFVASVIAAARRNLLRQ